MPPGLSVRYSSRAPLTGSGKAKMAMEVKEMSKVSLGKWRSMPFITAVSIFIPSRGDMAAMEARL